MERYPLYQSAIRHFEENPPIPVRLMRTEMVNCASDLEYLAKLHCIRLAFQYLFKVLYFYLSTFNVVKNLSKKITDKMI